MGQDMSAANKTVPTPVRYTALTFICSSFHLGSCFCLRLLQGQRGLAQLTFIQTVHKNPRKLLNLVGFHGYSSQCKTFLRCRQQMFWKLNEPTNNVIGWHTVHSHIAGHRTWTIRNTGSVSWSRVLALPPASPDSHQSILTASGSVPCEGFTGSHWIVKAMSVSVRNKLHID